MASLVAAGDQHRERQRDAEQQRPEQAAAHGVIPAAAGVSACAASRAGSSAMTRARSAVAHARPARDLVEGAAAAEAKPGAGIERADLDAGAFDHGGHARANSACEHKRRVVEGNRAIVAGCHVPARNSGRRLQAAPFLGRQDRLARRGAIGGACSVIGAIAAITRSGGKVTITSVPMRSLTSA